MSRNATKECDGPDEARHISQPHILSHAITNGICHMQKSLYMYTMNESFLFYECDSCVRWPLTGVANVHRQSVYWARVTTGHWHSITSRHLYRFTALAKMHSFAEYIVDSSFMIDTVPTRR